MKTAETAHNIRLPLVVKEVMEVEEDLDIICSAFSEQANFVLDITWYGNEVAKKITKELEVPYVKFDLSVSPILKFLDEFLFYRNATDAVIVFDNEKFIEQSLYYWLDTPLLRLATYGAESFTSGKIQKLRPVPQNVAIVAHTTEMEILVKAAIKEHAVTLPDRWILVFMDFNYTNFDKNLLNDSNITFLTINSDVCCLLKGNYDSCDCFGDYNVQENFGKYFANFLAKILIDIKSKKVGVFSNVVCNSTSVDGRNIGFFYTFLEKAIESDNLVIYNSSAAIRMKLNGTIIIGNEEVAKYSSENGVNTEPEKIKPIKKFYRIGTTHALPWSFQLKNETTGELYWTGYCIDLLQKLSEAMNFDYTIVTPKNGTFGEKINGIWDGIVGDLARGEIDLAFTAMVMTADKEEVIDFIPPYFEQSGISIVMRKPVRKTSLFKFMTVLKLEVWLSIVGALTSTGFLLWFLDKYSPYSGRNNKEAYPYSCREFTLKESFWFALTSFTPQGGGEAPKCLSGRTLVAGYWLFVVLMLATFTANLAAFLTVERMQTPVQSLEQLGRQSRINYTVVEGSETHKYFINMKFAEDTLYRMWKELTLNASIDDHRYRVWDYPIREQYGRILMAINDSMPVKDAEEGFRKVNEHEDADFAFIHDSSEIKYEVSRNCNLTEVGEVFAERPYAIAVQQGSRFQDDFSRNIIFLQRDRFFEFLQMKYWNHSNCRSDDSEGITLESLGGVFIATLFGLGLAMITLAFEVVYYKRKDAKAPKIKKVQPIKEISFITQPVTIGTDFKPVEKNMERMSHITLYPRARHRLNQPLPSVNN